MIKGKSIFVAGVGSIGTELIRQLAPLNKLFIFDLDETRVFDLVEELRFRGCKISGRTGDIRDKELVEEMFEVSKPDYVFHCAALKHVAPSMLIPREYITTNILGTLNILETARKYKTKKLINISTDKVVNGDSIMGQTKKVAERLTKLYGYISVRFGNVMASRGSVLEIWQRQIENNEPLTVTDERMTRYMMTIPEACKLLVKAAETGKPGDILIMDMGKKINILQLAKDILKKANKQENIKMIGIREGESLEEKLMTEEEEKRAIKQDEFFILHRLGYPETAIKTAIKKHKCCELYT